MFPVWEYEGGIRQLIIGLSDIMGKATPPMGPTVADTWLFVHEGIRVITQKTGFQTNVNDRMHTFCT